MNDLMIIVILVMAILFSFIALRGVMEYLDTVEHSLCAPKMILPNGTKICK